MEPNLRDAAQWAENGKRRKIRLAKIEEITRAWDDLFFILAGEEVFLKIPRVSDYYSFEKKMRQALEEGKHHHLTEDYPTAPPPDDLLNQLGELLSVDYTPPQTGNDMACDLIDLGKYYRSNFFSPSIEMILDFSLCKLMKAIGRLYGAVKARGETILTGRKKQKEEITKNIALVEEAFYHLKAIPKSLQKVAESISEYLLSKVKNVPSVKTIIRHMKSSDRIRNDLISMGIIKDKPTLVQ